MAWVAMCRPSHAGSAEALLLLPLLLLLPSRRLCSLWIQWEAPRLLFVEGL